MRFGRALIAWWLCTELAEIDRIVITSACVPVTFGYVPVEDRPVRARSR